MNKIEFNKDLQVYMGGDVYGYRSFYTCYHRSPYRTNNLTPCVAIITVYCIINNISILIDKCLNRLSHENFTDIWILFIIGN